MSAIGILVGFYGYLFPGNINLMVLELFATRRYALLLLIVVLIVLFESMYCFGTLYFLRQSMATASWFVYVEWTGYLLTLAMGLWMIFEKATVKGQAKGGLVRGIVSIVFHPQQIPFWLLMGVVFHTAIYNSNSSSSLPLFVLFNATGTLMVLGCYAFFGRKFIQLFRLRMHDISRAAGLCFVCIALYSMLRR